MQARGDCAADRRVARFHPGASGATFPTPRSRHHGVGFQPTEFGHLVEDVTPDRGLSPLRLAVPRLQAASEHGLVAEEAVFNAPAVGSPTPSATPVARPCESSEKPLHAAPRGRPWDTAERRGGITITTFSVPAAADPIVDRSVDVGPVRPETPDGNWGRVEKIRESSRLFAVSSAATINLLAATPMGSFRRPRRFFDALCLCAFHSPQPRILNSVESMIRSIGPSPRLLRLRSYSLQFRILYFVMFGG